MDPTNLLVVAATVSISAIVIPLLILHDRRTRAAWAQAAKDLGLSCVSDNHIMGKVEGLSVDISKQVEGAGKEAWTFTQFFIGGATTCQGVGVRRRGFTELFGGRNISTGDSSFDRQMEVRGDPLIAVAVLNCQAREVLLERLGDAELKHGNVVLKESGLLSDAGRLIALFEQCRDVALALSLAKSDLPAALAKNASDDPNPGVRVANLEMLACSFPRSPQARSASLQALGAREMRVRLAGAKLWTGPESFACLLSVMDRNQGADGEQRANALEHLLEAYPQADLGDTVETALASLRAAPQCVAARAIASGRHASQLGPRFAAPLAVPIQTLLVNMLESGAPACRVAAAGALGAAGSLAAVESLLPLTKALLWSGEVQLSARDAIRRIQARAGAIGAGRLSLVPTGALDGGLSLPARERDEPAGEFP